MGFHGNAPPPKKKKNPGCCHDYKLLSNNPQQGLITQLTEHKEVELVPTGSLQSYVLASLVEEGTLRASKGET